VRPPIIWSGEEVIQQIVSKTDGVPLFVEELTKSVVESVGAHDRAPLQALEIPSTLQDSLMARLDWLGTAKEIAQLGATLGREFTYELLTAVSPLKEEALQQRLKQLVESELVYQRGLPPRPPTSSSMRWYRIRRINRCSKANASSITTRLRGSSRRDFQKPQKPNRSW
jgi:predicted ATPase